MECGVWRPFARGRTVADILAEVVSAGTREGAGQAWATGPCPLEDEQSRGHVAAGGVCESADHRGPGWHARCCRLWAARWGGRECADVGRRLEPLGKGRRPDHDRIAFGSPGRACHAAASRLRSGPCHASTGTVCIASRLAERPGVIFARWREGAPPPTRGRRAWPRSRSPPQSGSTRRSSPTAQHSRS